MTILFSVLARNHRRWRRHGAFVRPFRAETRAQRFYGVSPASFRLRQRLLRSVQLLHEDFAVQIRISEIAQIGYISRSFQIDLRLEEERVETIEEKLPSQDMSIAETVVQLVQ